MKVLIFTLLFTAVVLPYVSYNFDKPLTAKQTEVLVSLSDIAFTKFVIVFFVNWITGNYSQVDKLWSIMPGIYAWTTAYKGGFSERQLLMAGLVTLWGLRLTFNFARKGGYTWPPWGGEEDYRWPVLRKNPLFANPIVWFLFNLFFISLYQSYLIMGFTLPMVLTVEENPAPLGLVDYLATALLLGFLILETLADEQQWAFQQEKKRQLASGKGLKEPYNVGFIRSGVWAISRHPNYFAEQAIWLSFYVFSVAATGRVLNWSLIGGLLLVLLFQGSADFSEKITAGKYPAYKEYQRTTAKFIPYLL